MSDGSTSDPLRLVLVQSAPPQPMAWAEGQPGMSLWRLHELAIPNGILHTNSHQGPDHLCRQKS
jgi:exonuclease I